MNDHDRAVMVSELMDRCRGDADVRMMCAAAVRKHEVINIGMLSDAHLDLLYDGVMDMIEELGEDTV